MEVSALVKSASKTACTSDLLCYVNDPHSKNHCIECGLPTVCSKKTLKQRLIDFNIVDAKILGAFFIFVLNIFDVLSTYLAASVGAHELNPIAKALMFNDIAGLPWIIPVKLVFGIVMLWLLSSVTNRKIDTMLLCLVWFVSGLYFFVVMNNFLVYFKG